MLKKEKKRKTTAGGKSNTGQVHLSQLLQKVREKEIKTCKINRLVAESDKLSA